MGSQWAGMGRELMCIDIFRESVLACSRAIEPFGISPLKLITEGTDEDFKDNTLHCFLGICAIQIGLTDLLRHLGLQEDGIIGHSTGEMASSYADGCTTREETMLIAYYRGKTILGAKFPPGAMAAIGLSWEQTLKRLPPAVFPACHNAPDSVTVSGDATKVAEFVKQMQQEGVFVKTVNSSGIAFHSPCMQIIAHEMREYLAKLLPNPKLRSKKWVSSSVPDDKLTTDLAKYSSADYHVNNMVSSVLFYSALRKLPENAIVIEVAPHCLLQAILKRGMPGGCQTFGLMSAKSTNNVEYLLQSLGKIYQAGANLNVQKLYPRASYPVPRGTPMLGPLLDWDHSQTWDVFTGPMKTLNCVCSYTIDPFSNESKDQYVLDHLIDGRVLYPFTGYLVLAWKALCKLRGLDWQKTPITIENVTCFRATIISKPIKLDVCVTLANGYFEILEEDSITCTGYIHLSEDANKKPFFYEHINEYPEVPEDDGIRLVTSDLYKEFQLRGYEYGPHFRGVLEAKNTGTSAELAWTGNWATFIDTLLQTNLIYEKGDTLKVPVRLRYLRIDPARQAEAVQEKDGKTFILARNHFPTLGCVGGGVEACDLACQSVPKRSQNQNVTLERIYYTPYFDQHCLDDFPDLRKDLHTYNDFCRQLAVEGIRKMIKSGDGLDNCKTVFEKIAQINEK
uniref:Malonyl-CoA:ACP transacylase (MAT) domain-containing protein n=1 Tax=Romanomermis culicivorax TaxID=13658 RepID=A0A915HMA7_ROMCU